MTKIHNIAIVASAVGSTATARGAFSAHTSDEARGEDHFDQTRGTRLRYQLISSAMQDHEKAKRFSMAATMMECMVLEELLPTAI